jgi:iron complex transport system substrate-binding protein
MSVTSPPEHIRHRRRPGLAALAAALLATVVLACGTGSRRPAPASGERLVALAPAAVELVYALGLDGRLVGVDDFSSWPPEVAEKPRLGGLFDPNLEAIVALEPDLAILLPSQRDLGRRLESLGIEILEIRSDSLGDVEAAMVAVAERCGVPERGRSLAAELREALAPRPLPRPLRVMVALGREPGSLSHLVVAGGGNFYDELLTRLGVTNVFAETAAAYPQVGVEAVLARRPEVILEILYQEVLPDSPLAAALREDWRPLGDVPAVRDGRIEILGGSHLVVPGPRLPLIYRQLEDSLRKDL